MKKKKKKKNLYISPAIVPYSLVSYNGLFISIFVAKSWHYIFAHSFCPPYKMSGHPISVKFFVKYDSRLVVQYWMAQKED